jgi:hypothetical protein
MGRTPHALRAHRVRRLLARTGASEAVIAQIAGGTSQQVNQCLRGPAAGRSGRLPLPAILDGHSPDVSEVMTEEAAFIWHETRGRPHSADATQAWPAASRPARACDQDKQRRLRPKPVRIGAAKRAQPRRVADSRLYIERAPGTMVLGGRLSLVTAAGNHRQSTRMTIACAASLWNTAPLSGCP